MTARERIRHRCECGASFVGSSVPAQMARDIYAIWVQDHEGPGHRKLAKGERRPRRKTAGVSQ